MKRTYTTFELLDDLKEFLEEYKIGIKKIFPLNRLDESCHVFPPKSEVYASDVLNKKFDYNRG